MMKTYNEARQLSPIIKIYSRASLIQPPPFLSQWGWI